MVLIIDDMVPFSSRAKDGYGPRMLFVYYMGRVPCGTMFSALGGRDGRLGRRRTEFKVLISVSMYGESRGDKAVITCSTTFLAVMVRIPCQPCAAALVDTNDSYNRCSGTVDSGHEDFSRVRGDIERHCGGVGSLAKLLFFLKLRFMNETKESPSNGRAITPGRQLLLFLPDGGLMEEIVGEDRESLGTRCVAQSPLLLCTHY